MRDEKDGYSFGEYSYRGSGRCFKCDSAVDYFRAIHWAENDPRPRFRWLTLNAGTTTAHSKTCNDITQDKTAGHEPHRVARD